MCASSSQSVYVHNLLLSNYSYTDTVLLMLLCSQSSIAIQTITQCMHFLVIQFGKKVYYRHKYSFELRFEASKTLSKSGGLSTPHLMHKAYSQVGNVILTPIYFPLSPHAAADPAVLR